MAKILIADDQDMMRDSLAATLARLGHDVTAANDGPTAITRLSQSRFDLMITDYRMPKMNGNELLAEAKKLRPEMPVVLMSAFATVPNAVEAMKLGAFDYIQKPFDGYSVTLIVDRALEHGRLKFENAALKSMAEHLAPKPLIGNSEAMSDVKKRMEQVAKKDATVLIRGESGTGKEVSPARSTRHRIEPIVRCSPSTALRYPRTCSNRNCSVTRRVRSRAPTGFVAADLSWPTVARCCSTKSAKLRPVCRPSCSGCFRKTRSSASGRRSRSRWTCA